MFVLRGGRLPALPVSGALLEVGLDVAPLGLGRNGFRYAFVVVGLEYCVYAYNNMSLYRKFSILNIGSPSLHPCSDSRSGRP